MKKFLTQKRYLIWALILDLAAAVVILCAPLIKKLMFAVFTDCVFAKHGILCPSCGGTRSFYSFFTGDFAKAFSLNPYYFFVFIYLIIIFVWFNIAAFSNKEGMMKYLRKIANPKAVIILAIAYVLFGIMRNLQAVI